MDQFFPVLIIGLLLTYGSPDQDLKIPTSWETGYTDSKEENESHRESKIGYPSPVEAQWMGIAFLSPIKKFFTSRNMQLLKFQASSLRGGIPKILPIICLAQYMPSELRYLSVSLTVTELSNTIWPQNTLSSRPVNCIVFPYNCAENSTENRCYSCYW